MTGKIFGVTLAVVALIAVPSSDASAQEPAPGQTRVRDEDVCSSKYSSDPGGSIQDRNIAIGVALTFMINDEYVWSVGDYQVVDQDTGAVVATVPANGSWTPTKTGSYDISTTYYVSDCPVVGQPPVPRGPLTAKGRAVVRPLFSEPSFLWFRTPNGKPFCYGPRPCPRGTAQLWSAAPCGETASRLTLTFRYTLNGTRPSKRSPGWRRTESCGRAQRTAVRRGRWGELRVGSGEGGQATALATPGTRLRVWIEWSAKGKPLGAVRARARTRGGKVSWVADGGGCPGTPKGCSPLRHVGPHERPPR